MCSTKELQSAKQGVSNEANTVLVYRSLAFSCRVWGVFPAHNVISCRPKAVGSLLTSSPSFPTIILYFVESIGGKVEKYLFLWAYG
jgi:hypothetical protein